MTSFGTDNPTLLALVKKKEPTPKVPKKTPTKPTKSVGVKGTRENRALLLAQNPPAISEKELANIRKGVRVIDSFNIKYTDRQSGARVFNFALPPAVDNILTYSGSGSFRGNASVPDVKAGLPIRTTMKHKNIVIPGGTNVVQTIGVDSKYIVLVGAFIGSEEFSTKPKTPGVSRSSYQTAKEFDERVVQQGAPISLNVTINAAGGAETIDITGVIVDFKAYAVRRAKAYYSITVLYTKYPKIKPPAVKEAAAQTTPAATPAASTAASTPTATPAATPAASTAASTPTATPTADKDKATKEQEQEQDAFIRIYREFALSAWSPTVEDRFAKEGFAFKGFKKIGNGKWAVNFETNKKTQMGLRLQEVQYPGEKPNDFIIYDYFYGSSN